MIAAAPYQDRVVHHALCNIIEPILDKAMVFDSYACRVNKGSHRAIQHIKEELKIGYYVRYMDDALLFAPDKQTVGEAKTKIRTFLEMRRLKLHELKSQVFPTRHGVRFLGFHIYPDKLKISRPNLQRFKKRLKAKSWLYRQKGIGWENILLSLNAWLGFADKQKNHQFINEVLSYIKFRHPDCSKAFNFLITGTSKDINL